MKCPECVEQGERSRVILLAETTTLLTIQKFWDEDGFFHLHDPNTITRVFKCSNGHSWHEEKRGTCACGRVG